MPFSPTLPDKPSARQVRETLCEAGQYLAGLQGVEQDRRDESFVTDVRSVRDYIENMDAVHKALVAAETPKPSQSRGPTAAFDDVSQHPRSLSDRLITDERYREFIGRHGGSHESRDFQFIGDGASLFQRTLITTSDSDTSAGGVFLPVAQPVPPVVQERRLFVRDLMNVEPTTFNSMPYIQEVNSVALEGGASATAEGDAKAEVEMSWTDEDAPVRKVTAWVPVTNEIIEDAPQLRGYIDRRLTYLVLLREEQLLLKGTGVGAQIKGALQFSGVQSQTGVADDLPATVAQMIGKVGNVDGTADAVALNVLDFWQAAATRHTASLDHGFGGGAPAILSSLTWSLPPVQTRALVRGEIVVANWRMASTITDRQDVIIRVGNQHSTFFVENKVAILCEERFGHMCHRPDYYVHCEDFAFS